MNYPGTNEPRRRYRLNGKKLAATLVMMAFVAAVAVVAIMALKDASDAEVATVGGDIQATQGNIISVVTITKAPETPTATVAAAAQTPGAGKDGLLASRVIVVDAGHGGFDPGAIGVSGAHEDAINLAVAQYLKTALQDEGAKVIMTREDEDALAGDKDADMAERRRIIEQSGSDIVISIHMNNYKDDQSVCGPLVLFMPGSDKGKTLADSVQACLNAALDADASARSERLFILKSGYQPCVLVECGYLSNKDEEEDLQQSDYQRKVAKAICDGVTAFFSTE